LATPAGEISPCCDCIAKLKSLFDFGRDARAVVN
jgi:hypothetical protein